jgi:cytidylate kinase
VPLSGVIALDGPSGTGKSTVARTLALRLGSRYLDTGAMYRAVTWAVLTAGIAPGEEAAVVRLVDGLELEIGTDPHRTRVVADGVRVERQIRSAEVTAAVSAVSAVPAVRERLVSAQRRLIAVARGIVVEGRDIGTVVAPDARLKAYLTASAEARATRRARQDGQVSAADIARTAEALDRRDGFDSSRPASPLRPAADAVLIDTTLLSRDEVVDRLVALAEQRGLVTAPDPSSTDPSSTDPSSTDPSSTDPSSTDPSRAGPR